jgi:hypothetical protein
VWPFVRSSPRTRPKARRATYDVPVRGARQTWWGAVLLSLALASGVAAASAAADTYCVAPAGGCDHAALSIQDGLDEAAAHGGADTVQLGASTYKIDPDNAPSYPTSGFGTATLQGMGSAATTVEPVLAPLGSESVIGAIAGTSGDLNVRALRVRSNGESSTYGIATAGTLFEDLKIEMTGKEPTALRLSTPGAAVRNSSISQLGGGFCVSVSPTSVASTRFLLGHDSFGNCTIQTGSGNVLLEHDTLKSPGLGVSVGAGETQIENSLITITGTGAAVYVSVNGSASTLVTIDQSTIVCNSKGSGLRAFNTTGSGTASLDVHDTIVRGFANSIEITASPSHPASVTGGYVDYASATAIVPSGATVAISNPYDNVDPHFTNSAAGDYTLAAGSPLIDQDPTPLGAADSPSDLVGNLRLIGPARDLGAYERLAAPTADAAEANGVGDTSAVLGGTVSGGGTAGGWQILYGTSSAYGRATAEGSIAASNESRSVSATVGGLTPGVSYHFAIRVQTSHGTVTSGDRTFTTLSPTPLVNSLAGSSMGAGGGATHAIVPAIGSIKLSPSRFRAAPKGQTLAKAAKQTAGSLLSFTLNVSAEVRFAIVRRTTGVRSHGRCIAPKPARGAHPKRCSRPVKVGRPFSVKAAAGANALRFSGRVAGRRLAAGDYLLEARPAGGAGARAPFAILP